MQASTGASPLGQPDTSPPRWQSEQFLKFLTMRTASEDARFVLGFLKPGMSLLDCGCGPGSISLGLASYVAPGEVLGIDINPKLIEQAEAAAVEQGVTNVQFEVGDAQALRVDDSTFDVVFSHALLEHLPRPQDGLAQMKRALKSGGIIALRVPEWSGNLTYPDDNNLGRRLNTILEQISRMRGSDPYRGRHIGALLDQQGFVDIRLTASYTSFGTPEAVAALSQFVREALLSSASVETVLAQGKATQEEIGQVKADVSAWAQMPGAFEMRAWIEAVARKP